MKIVGIVLGIIVLLILLLSYFCFYLAFYASRKEAKDKEEFDIPRGKIYEPYRDEMIGWMKETRNLPHKDFCIKSFDGLNLYGKYYEYKPGAPIELMFHGYRGTAERDLCGGVMRCFELERNVLIVDQRASGRSEGHVISFGINEKRDCLAWIDFVISEFGPEVKIILTGISMGASTVLMAAGTDLPDNVIGVLADCGYTSAKAIIKKVIKQIHLPANILYPFVKLGGKIFGKIDIEEDSPIEAMKKCRVPVIFVHGETDDFVPCYMSRENYEACVAPKKLITTPSAGHGLCYMVDKKGYLREVREGSKMYGA